MRAVTTRTLVRALIHLAGRQTPARAAAALGAYLTSHSARARLPVIRALLRDERFRRGAVELEVAQPPSEPAAHAVNRALARRFPTSPVRLRVNRALLGGFRLTTAGWTIDGSLARALTHLRQRLEVPHA